ncbi:alpha-hydroxy-acid oxidizing protein [Pseudomonas sp. Snoq117.2]|uniref:alpha-hydroxy-acid oxidizing protein n=1 Tax=unclassified Pseudomonas TaxID=196821 RepID=UPI00353226EC
MGLSANREVLKTTRLHAHAVVLSQSLGTATTLWTITPLWPFLIGLTGYKGKLHKHADPHLARAAAAVGVPFCLSTVAC